MSDSDQEDQVCQAHEVLYREGGKEKALEPTKCKNKPLLEATCILDDDRHTSQLESGEVPLCHHHRLLYQAQRSTQRCCRQGCNAAATTTSGGVRLCTKHAEQQAGYIQTLNPSSPQGPSVAGPAPVDAPVEKRKADTEGVRDRVLKQVQNATRWFGLVQHQGQRTYYKVSVRLGRERTTEAAVCELVPLGLQAIVPRDFGPVTDAETLEVLMDIDAPFIYGNATMK